jgi:hypothetical protein
MGPQMIPQKFLHLAPVQGELNPVTDMLQSILGIIYSIHTTDSVQFDLTAL